MINAQEDKIYSEGIEFLSPPSEYRMADEWYDIAKVDHFWIKWRFEIMKRLLPKGFNWDSTLDVGCGSGISAEQIAGYYGYAIAGCDLNLESLKMASLKHSKLYFYNIHHKCHEFKEAFSNILLLDVLEHIQDPGSFLNSIKFHLKPGGRLIINVPAIQLLYSRYDEVAGHLRRYSISSLRSELNSMGFILENACYWGLSFVPLLLIRKCVLHFCKRKNVIAWGFQPRCSLINSVLELIAKAEYSIFPCPFIGTSLMVVARKRG